MSEWEGQRGRTLWRIIRVEGEELRGWKQQIKDMIPELHPCSSSGQQIGFLQIHLYLRLQQLFKHSSCISVCFNPLSHSSTSKNTYLTSTTKKGKSIIIRLIMFHELLSRHWAAGPVMVSKQANSGQSRSERRPLSYRLSITMILHLGVKNDLRSEIHLTCH